ncbi:T9SS type A sorting domain-containing protein [Altibacter sp. HG106]|uniref:T9SS type A sorting domain-containing protein n=1 Tax=Altibacter sp. HG106 TaxID=3023937 RepID=UPI002350EBFF|nr:T9SS type A sorting domain-containing protein [Altibacter sp. HG106]MDC7993788.1 T9SS type A sorting domain-containing protein [Altibacter sp. HG106]
MKTKRQRSLLLISIGLLFGFYGLYSIFPTAGSEESPTQEALLKQYPGEWFYNQRAYPNNFISREAMAKAETQVQSILAERDISGGAWTLAGPLNTGGRITDVAISPDSDDVLYVGIATGGIFKTTDGGTNWTPIFDDMSKYSIGDLAIAPSNAEIIYAGTGEANASANSGAFFGDGVYRSNNSGADWLYLGPDGTDHIGRIAVDVNDPNRIFVAATGRLYGYNDERGIYRSTNGGDDWDKVLFVTDSTAAIDVAIHPGNPDIVLAAMWERTRKPWQRDYGGVTSAIHRSTDGGDTWTQLGAANGLPAPDTETGRIGFEFSQSDPDIVYARYTTDEITNEFNGLYKSTDGGQNWTLVTLNDLFGIDASFGWYFGNLRVNPNDPDDVFVLGQSLARTFNGGGSWNAVNGMHVDHHAIEFSRNNPNFILAGNDGGAYVSTNGGSSWNKFVNLPITQFYNIEVDFLEPQNLYGGTQDNNTIRTTTGGLNDWNSIWGGDGFHVVVDYSDNNFIYVESQYGNLGKSSNGGATFQNATSGISGSDRNNWNTPIAISPVNPQTMYYGTQRVYSSDRANFWTAISPDLTDGQHPSGSLVYGTLTTIAASYLTEDVIYVGSDDGNVQVTFDGGTTWENISDGLPDRYVTSVAISPTDDETAYVTLSGFRENDQAAHVFKTIDAGQNWTNISGNLPAIPVNDIVLFPEDNLLIIATDLNVWYSNNEGASWTILGDNLPLTMTRDLKIHEPTNTLYAGTFGRSIHSYDLDDLVFDTADNQQSNALVLYPNPAHDRVQIVHPFSETVTVTLFGMQGNRTAVLYEGAVTTGTIELELEGIASGIYFVECSSGSAKITRKLIIR